jgi:hypothetical protein
MLLVIVNGCGLDSFISGLLIGIIQISCNFCIFEKSLTSVVVDAANLFIELLTTADDMDVFGDDDDDVVVVFNCVCKCFLRQQQ